MKSHPLAPIIAIVFLVFLLLWVCSSCQTPAGRLKQNDSVKNAQLAYSDSTIAAHIKKLKQ